MPPEAEFEAEVVDSELEPLPDSLPLAAAIHLSRQPVSVIMAAQAGSSRPAKSNALFLRAALLLMLLGATGVGGWLTLGASSGSQTAELPSCLRADAAAPCAQAIVTGATAGSPVPPSVSHTRPDASAASPAVDAAPVDTTEILARGVQEVPKVLIASTESVADGLESRSPGAGSLAPALPGPIAMAIDPLPPAVIAANQLAPPQEERSDRLPCRELVVAAQSMSIRFDYASPYLDRAALASLSAFVVRLQACPSVIIIIEGHTDSDGYENRNDKLSWYRAEAVRESLITAGAKAEQLSIIGFGQSRPVLPNVTTENKRQNRRVALVVERRP